MSHKNLAKPRLDREVMSKRFLLQIIRAHLGSIAESTRGGKDELG